jgi:tetratricopeptide (TPR) repeat protein
MAAPPPDQLSKAEQARQLWEQGQAAMRVGQAIKAIPLYHQSLAVDPGLVRNYLSLAAAYLDCDRLDAACIQLATYLHYHPEQFMIRAHFAELLLKLERFFEARDEFERFADDCPTLDGNDLKQMIHCHSRLMEIAETIDDEYAQHLHRGIGLYLLAKHRAKAGSAHDELPPEGLLCKAAAELTQARLRQPDQARPSWYLYQVWSRLGRHQTARRHLHEADLDSPFSDLTPAEHRGLALARQMEATLGVSK